MAGDLTYSKLSLGQHKELPSGHILKLPSYDENFCLSHRSKGTVGFAEPAACNETQHSFAASYWGPGCDEVLNTVVFGLLQRFGRVGHHHLQRRVSLAPCFCAVQPRRIPEVLHQVLDAVPNLAELSLDKHPSYVDASMVRLSLVESCSSQRWEQA